MSQRSKALFLSSENYHGQSVAAVGVAAHEAGHALQHQAAYGMFSVRMALVPVTQFASYAYMGIFFIGIFFGLLLAVAIQQLADWPVAWFEERSRAAAVEGRAQDARVLAEAADVFSGFAFRDRFAADPHPLAKGHEVG